MSDKFPIIESARMPDRVIAIIGANTVLTHLPTGEQKVFNMPLDLVTLAGEARKFQDECERGGRS